MKFVTYLISLAFLITSCQEKTKSPPTEEYETISQYQSLPSFPNKINESSGLAYTNEQVWTHNDGGDGPNLYSIDIKTGKILSTLKIAEAHNTDWEDISHDSLYLYIGDFGNNQGNRQDLNILKIKKPETKSDTSYTASQINFSYADQNNFIFKKEVHNFNAEALINVDDSLFIFTKNHVSRNTRCYSIPKNPNTYEISPSSQFNTEGLITAADFDAENRVLILLGYNDYFLAHAPFIWCFWDFNENDFFKGKSKRFNLDFTGQAEGIAISEPGIILISTEKEAGSGGNIWQIDLRQRVKGLW